MKFKTIAVTGAGGFIGSNFCKFLKEKGHIVVGIDKNDFESKYVDRFVKADLTNYIAVSNIFKDVDYIFHFAADMGGVGYFSKEQYKPTLTNYLSDLNIIKYCSLKQIPLFYPSSACIYPTYLMEDGEMLSEEMLNRPAQPDQMYGWEKLSITRLSLFVNFPMRVGIFHTIFGIGQTWTGPKAKFPPEIVYKVLMAMRNKTPIEIWGNGQQERTFQYIDDAVEKIYEIAMADEYHGPVNVSSDEIVTVLECAKWLCDHAGIDYKFNFDLSKPSGVQIRRVDNSKFKKYYKYRDQVSTKQGFIKMFDWLKSQI